MQYRTQQSPTQQSPTLQSRTRSIDVPRHACARWCWCVLALMVAFLPACRTAPFGGLGTTSPEELLTPADATSEPSDAAASETTNGADTPSADGPGATDSNATDPTAADPITTDSITSPTHGTDSDAADSDAVDSDAAATATRERSVAETVRSARERIGSWDQPPAGSAIDLTNGSWRHATSAELATSAQLATSAEPDDTRGGLPRAGAGPQPRWRHAVVDDWLATSAARREEIRHLLNDENPTVRGNAAIALARAGLADALALAELTATLGRINTKLPMRRAAAESLAWVEPATAVPWLIDLVDEFSSVAITSDGRAAAQAGRSAELHAELLRALAVHARAADEPRFTWALDSRSPLVLIDTLDAWGTPPTVMSPVETSPGQTLPVQIVSLCDHPRPKVRLRAIRALAVHHHRQAMPRLIAGLADRDWIVRRSAIASLALLGDDEAIGQLEQLLHDPGEIVRAEAVTALAHTSAWQLTAQALGDESRRVREALAASLAERRDSAAHSLAEQLVTDRAVTVQAAVLAATHDWPHNMAGDVLIGGLTSQAAATRHGCRDELLRRWPAAQALILDVESTLSGSHRSESALTDLRKRWHAEFGDAHALAQKAVPAQDAGTATNMSVSPELLRDVDALLSRYVAAERRGERDEPSLAAWTSLATAPHLLDALGLLVSEHGRTVPDALYDDVLPRLDSTFEVLGHIESNDPQQRRVAAGELRDRAATEPLSPLVVARLRQILVYERDALVWQAVLRAIGGDHYDHAMTLASVALGHDQPMIRRQACEHIAAAANASYAHLLVDALSDTDQSVRRAALRGLAFPRAVDDVTPLLRFMADTDVTMRFEAARTMTIIGSSAGLAALERMAYHNDANVRRMVAEAMGELAQPVFTATLVAMLDDETRVQRTALASLPACVGDATPAQVHDRGNSQAALVDIWQDWWAESRHSFQNAAYERASFQGSLRAARR